MFPPSRLWSLSHPGTKTTIDLTLTNTPERTIRCQIYHDNYGSDHRATYSEWDLQPEMRREQRPRRAYERTEWERVGEMILASMTLLPRVDSEAQLDQLVNHLIEATITAVEAHLNDGSQQTSRHSKLRSTKRAGSGRQVVQTGGERIQPQ
jgi:hypothetical protein